jgi:hypothetical protein
MVINMETQEGVQWEVTYNARYGQPGPLAYKVDTLVVNRRLDQLEDRCLRRSESVLYRRSAACSKCTLTAETLPT